MHLIKDADMSQQVISDVVEIVHKDNVGIQLSWVGDAVGSFAVQVSLDYKKRNGVVINSGKWIGVTLNPVISAVGSNDDAYVDLNQISATHMRVVFTPSEGSGTLNVHVSGKGL